MPDPNDPNKSYVGTSDRQGQYDPDIHKYILKDIKKDHAYIWLPGEAGKNPNSDVRTKFDKKKDKTLQDYIKRVKENGISEFVITAWHGGQESIYVKGDQIYRI